MNAIEQIYNQLMEVFGGTNSNQIFSMMMPGIILNPTTYAYNTNNAKPATIQEAESKLVDQMFDIAKVSGAPNGQRVSSQYQQALSILIPKFNALDPLLKKTLRDYLNSLIEVTGEDGQTIKVRLIDHYFSLYNDWIKAKQDWETMMYNKKQEFSKNPEKENELFLEWYTQIAEGQLALIEQKMAKVVAVFAPSDMNSILGALAAGPGGEVQEALNVLTDIRLESPNGGFFYPVDLLPNDWFLDLTSDIDPVNLLKDPEFMASTIATKRRALEATIYQVTAIISQMPVQGAIKQACDNLVSAQKEFSTAHDSLVSTYSENTAIAANMCIKYIASGTLDVDTLKIAADKVKALKKGDSSSTNKKDVSNFADDDLAKLVQAQKNVHSAQSKLLSSVQAVSEAGINLASTQASYFSGLPLYLTKLQSQLTEINDLQDKMLITPSSDRQLNVGSAPEAGKGGKTAKKSEVSERFMELQFSFHSDEMDSSSSSDASFSQSHWGVDLFFGSASGTSSSSKAVTAKSAFNSQKEIKIGLMATRVDIERGWFNPGVFKLTTDMNRISSSVVSRGGLKDVAKDISELNEALLPGFPTSFLVAKDVTLTFEANEEYLSAVQSVIDSKSASGGGFLCFSCSSSSQSHHESSSLSSRSQGNVISISMPGPQILGWFIELTPKDKSAPMVFDPNTSASNARSAEDSEISIINYINQLSIQDQVK